MRPENFTIYRVEDQVLQYPSVSFMTQSEQRLRSLWGVYAVFMMSEYSYDSNQ